MQLPPCYQWKRLNRVFACARYTLFSIVTFPIIIISDRTSLISINDSIVAPTTTRPCNPTPCGPNSICREVNDQAVCTCAPEYLGTPPLCRPECVVSSDCRKNQACVNQKCRDPCPGTCGIQATCLVVNHNPVCSCPERYTGDPFVRCEMISKILRYLLAISSNF